MSRRQTPAKKRRQPGLPLRLRWQLWWQARLLPVAARRRSLLQLLQAALPARPDSRWHPAAAAVVEPVLASVARPWRMRGRRCLREGLLAFRFLRLAGHPAVLHFGIDPQSLRGERVRAHCWVSVGDEILVNPPQPELPGRNFVEIFKFDGEARNSKGERLTAMPMTAFPG